MEDCHEHQTTSEYIDAKPGKNDLITKSHHANGCPCSLRGRAVLERRGRRQEGRIFRSTGKGRATAHADELCGRRPEDDAPCGCSWCCGRRGRCLLRFLLRTGRGRL